MASRSRTEDDTFLTEFVEIGSLAHVTGTASAPPEATRAHREGHHTTAYDKYGYELKQPDLGRKRRKGG